MIVLRYFPPKHNIRSKVRLLNEELGLLELAGFLNLNGFRKMTEISKITESEKA